MQALIDLIMRNLRTLWPLCRVYEWQLAMMVRNGRILRLLTPGLHWQWPFVDEVYTWTRAESAIDLASGGITTRDGIGLTLSGNLAYRAVNIVPLWTKVWGIEATLRNVALGIITSHCLALTWDEVRARDGIEATLLERIRTETAEWGVEITRLHLTDCIATRGHRHFVDGLKSP